MSVWYANIVVVCSLWAQTHSGTGLWICVLACLSLIPTQKSEVYDLLVVSCMTDGLAAAVSHVSALSHSTRTLDTFLPARRYASAGNSDRNVSVRPSRAGIVKTKKGSGMISSSSGSPKTLVFWRQISSPNSKGFPPKRGLKQGSVGKIQQFSSLKRQYLENGSRYVTIWNICV